jgi:hypothetical protein
LAAYVVLNDQFEITPKTIRLYTQNILPKFMVPSKFIIVEKIPLTTSGKIDRNALTTYTQTWTELNKPFTPPQTYVESILAKFWMEVLQVGRVGIHHNFFDLGGHSLLATMLVSRIRRVFPIDLSLPTFFQSQTIEELTHYLVINESYPGEVNEISKIFLSINNMDVNELKAANLQQKIRTQSQ